MAFDSDYVLKVNEAAARGAINLAIGEPRFTPPHAMLEALEASCAAEFGYPPVKGLPELREAIRGKLKSENGFSAEDVLVTTGAIEAVFDCMVSRLSRGTEALMFAPHYGKYVTPPGVVGAKIRTVGLKNGRPDMDAMRAAVNEKTRIIVHNSPANPTGIVFTEDEVRQLAELATAHDLVLLSDETYEKFIFDPKQKHVSPARYSDRVLTINSFSKAYGFPGLRIGYVAGSTELVAPAAAIHVSNTTCCPYGAQKAALAALQSGFSPPLQELAKKREILITALDAAGIEFIPPEGAFYAYAYLGKKSEDAVCNGLMANGVLLMPGRMFGGSKAAVRICYTESEERLMRGLSALVGALA